MSRRLCTKKFVRNAPNGKYILAIGNEIILDAKKLSQDDALFMDIF